MVRINTYNKFYISFIIMEQNIEFSNKLEHNAGNVPATGSNNNPNGCALGDALANKIFDNKLAGGAVDNKVAGGVGDIVPKVAEAMVSGAYFNLFGYSVSRTTLYIAVLFVVLVCVYVWYNRKSTDKKKKKSDKSGKNSKSEKIVVVKKKNSVKNRKNENDDDDENDDSNDDINGDNDDNGENGENDSDDE